MLSICLLLGEANDFTVAGLAVKLQSVTLELGSIEGMTLICCARCPFPFPLNAGLELGQFHQITVTRQHRKRERQVSEQ